MTESQQTRIHYARARTLDRHGTMMPPGLTRRDRAPIAPEGVVETWD